MKKQHIVYYIFVAALVLKIGHPLDAMAMPEAKMTMNVVDEVGNAMPGIKVAIGFDGFAKIKAYNGYTDASGKFTASNETAGGVSCAAEKEGYYDSRGRYDFSYIDNNRWTPWNSEVQLSLRKIEKPTPMYARDTHKSRLEIPVVGKEVGFDLMEFEWMPPYGKGKQSDFIFKLDKRFVSEDEFESTLTIIFMNKNDGIQLIQEDRRYGSVFKLPRFAPEAGYQNSLFRSIRKIPGKPIVADFRDDNNYIFRVRSEVKNGKLVRAMYGKIQGDIEVYPGNSKTAAIVFKYYLNPDHTRNLEYDPKRNLFQNLRSTESVGL